MCASNKILQNQKKILIFLRSDSQQLHYIYITRPRGVFKLDMLQTKLKKSTTGKSNFSLWSNGGYTYFPSLVVLLGSFSQIFLKKLPLYIQDYFCKKQLLTSANSI
jgi:hypothetical protein